MKRILFSTMAVALGAAMGAAAVPAAIASTSAPRAVAASPTVGQIDGNVSSTALSSWQTDGIVFALAYGNGVVYAGGNFSNARPPGAAAGDTSGEVSRTFLAAFSSTTGALISSFDPTITYSGSNANPGVYALALSPDGSTLYVGGIFDHVNGSARNNLAAFNTSTGALTSWNPAAAGKVDGLAVSPDGSAIYIGGDLSKLKGATRTYAGAVSSANQLLPWAPVLDSTVYSLKVAPDDSQVVLGGYFQHINGVAQNSAGAVDPVNGTTNWPWGLPSTFLPHVSSCQSAVKDVVISGSTAYLAAEGNGGGCFDGDFAVSLGSTDQLVWQSDCLGATQALEVVDGFLFKGSHAHDCAYEPGGFPQVNAAGGGWVTWHLLDQSLSDGTLGHWTPATNVGSTWSGTGNLGPHAMATDGSQLFVGGDFTTVNGKPQQGVAIFPATTSPVPPVKPAAAPTVTSTSAGVDSVSFPAVSSQDAGTLSYKIFRDGGSSPIATLTATSWPWALPVLRYQDSGLTPGSQHTYTYQAYDGTGSAKSPASAPVTVSSTSPAQSYQQTVLNDDPSFLWPLNETSGSTANDASPHGFNATYEAGTTQGATGPFSGQPATSFDGNTGLVSSQSAVTGPQTFSIEGWFNTTTDDGGKLIGFGNAQTGSSANYDRHIYMMNDGQLVFGIWNSQTVTIETPNAYNDGSWHYVVATYNSSSGTLTFYVDGQLIGTNTTSSAQGYIGYWRIGGDNLGGGWNLDPWGSNSQGTTQPHSYYFNGTMADVAVYPVALSASQVAAHYAAALQQGIG
jgi:concanavalin A-like lectin/glucanase superfamily protein